MNLLEVHNGWKDKDLFVDLSLGNVCNYKCSYCFPGANEGNAKWPSNYSLFQDNVDHLLSYYQIHQNKKLIDIHFVGGEPTHWPRLLDFITFLKQRHPCLISMTSNGSKKLAFWQEVAPYFDKIHMSCHHQYVDVVAFREVCDYLYEQNVLVSVSVMMDPNAWSKCMDIVDQLKQSRHKWAIRYSELNGAGIEYTDEQQKILRQYRARRASIFWFLKNNKYPRSKVRVIDQKNKKHRFYDNEIINRKLNNFFDWQCSVGVNWIHINHFGTISGTCGQTLYGENQNYNIRDQNFIKNFQPKIIPSRCSQLSCNCMSETTMPKKKVVWIKN